MTRADLAKQPSDVAAMFDLVAKNYDLADSVLTFGLERYWRAATRRALRLPLGSRILDLAAGTGTSTAALRLNGKVVACDFSEGMMRQGMRRLGHTGIAFVGGDATRLPFADASFDAVTISFGLRNVVDVTAALSEMRRITVPGGRLLVTEFSRPTNAVTRWAYYLYLERVLPVVARLVATNPKAYSYLTESIRAWPDQAHLAHQIELAGWQRAKFTNLNGGVVALHSARAPQRPSYL